MKISIIVPTLGRTQRFLGMLKTLEAGAAGFDHEVVAVTDDQETILACQTLPVRVAIMHGNAIEAFNAGAAAAEGDWFVLAADDVRFYPDWLALALATPNSGFIGFYEGVTWTDEVGHFMVSRDFACDVLGGVLVPPVYKSWFADREVCALAKRAGMYAVTKDIVIEHLHHTLGKSPNDATYAKGAAWHKGDEGIYEQREKLGFQIDWHPIIERRNGHAG